MKKMRFCLALLLLFAYMAGAGCQSHTRTVDGDVRRQIAQRYGIDSFDRIETIRFTFNAQVGSKHVRRSWLWKPTNGEVTHWPDRQAAAERFTHPIPAENTDGRERALDAKFVNDRYWLLFPLHLVWDQALEVADRGQSQRPIGEGQARRIEVRYPPAGGYTPGDVYELFVDANGQILEWVYRRGGDVRPTRMSTWEDHRQLGPLWVSLEHQGPGGFRVWFTDVAIELQNEPGWVYPTD